MGEAVRTRAGGCARGALPPRDLDRDLALVRVHRRGRPLIRAGVAAILGAAGVAGAVAHAQAPASPGEYDFAVATRTFDSPLFGDERSLTYHFFGHQALPEAGRYQLWLDGGLAGYDTHFGLRGAGIRAGDHLLGFDAGDFALRAIEPETVATGLGDSYPLRGGEIRGERDGIVWSGFAGQAYYDVSTPLGERRQPTLIGGRFRRASGRNSFGADLTLVGDTPFADPERDGDGDVVLTGRYARQIGPWTRLFAETSAATQGYGARGGAAMRWFRGDLSTALYAFDDGMPYVYPIYRPGERGLEVRGRFDVSSRSAVHGAVYYATDDAVRERDELRGSAGLRLALGPRVPAISIDYSHDDVVYRTLEDSANGTLADRLALTLSKAENHGYAGLTVEHAHNAETGLDRGQALLILRRVMGPRTLLDGTAVLQRDEASNLGGTAEAAVQRPLAGSFSYLAGLGAGWVERSGASEGEGVLRLGVSRRLRGTGWHARVEARIPFSIGLERSSLNRQVFALDVGHRFAWNDLGSLGSAFGRGDERGPTGAIEGVVLVEGEPRGGIGVIVNGEPRATTRHDGSFAVRGVSAGEAFVTLDLRGFEPGLDVAGDRARSTFVSPDITSHLEFHVQRFSSLQGALVRCAGERLVAVKAAQITLSAEGFTRSETTSVAGAFQFDRIPPGVYELALDAEDAAGFAPTPIDLTEDVIGHVVKLDCP